MFEYPVWPIQQKFQLINYCLIGHQRLGRWRWEEMETSLLEWEIFLSGNICIKQYLYPEIFILRNICIRKYLYRKIFMLEIFVYLQYEECSSQSIPAWVDAKALRGDWEGNRDSRVLFSNPLVKFVNFNISQHDDDYDEQYVPFNNRSHCHVGFAK